MQGGDPDHFIVPGKVYEYAAVCHNTVNLLNRNIIGGRRGCDCVSPGTSCDCLIKPFLDGRNYSIDKVIVVDVDWFSFIMCGTKWEVLSADLDKEDPDAACVLSIAFNKKNEIISKTNIVQRV